MEQNIEVGITLSAKYLIKREHSGKNIGSGEVEVLSTPSMVAFMEDASRKCVQPKLSGGYITVGTEICIKHLNPVPIGESLTVRVRLEEVDKRRLKFKVTAEWRGQIIGVGRHERFIVDKMKFLQRLKERSGIFPTSISKL